MKRTVYITFFIFFFINYVSSQNSSLKSFVEKTNELELDMWDLVDYANEHLNDDQELARFFYQWIGTNIKYDHELLTKLEKGNLTNKIFWESQDYYHVYQSRKGICAGYANLFQWFMREMDIETVIISGHIRDERNHYVELESDDDFRHAWNAIKLNNKWVIVDSTWGTSGDSSISDFYFDMKPELAIITHFPGESKWQFLENPLSLDKFNASQYINPLYFLTGFTEKPSLKQDSNYYYFVHKNNPKRNWLIRLQFGTDSINYESILGIKVINQDGYTYYRFDKKQIPEKAAFKVDLNNFNEEKQTMILYENIILFQI